MQRVTINGRRRDLGLGGWPVVSLARARQRAFANRVAISEGRDPLAEKRKASVPTFREAAANETLIKLLREQGVEAVPHGFRSSFRDWCADTGKPREVAEAALAHVVGVEGAYFRSDLFERRRQLMAAWAAYLTGGRAKVVRLHG